MKKVGFFKSIHLKFIIIYVLLILVAMQVIGVYFVKQLEEQLVSNFWNSVNERVRYLAYNIEQEITENAGGNSVGVETKIYNLLQDFVSEDIIEVQVIDDRNRIIGSSNPYNQGVIGKKTTDIWVKRALTFGTEKDRVLLDPNTGKRVRVLSFPIKSNDKVLGAIYLEAQLENVYIQMKEINRILAAGTGIAMGITALLGIFLARTITRPMDDMRKQALAMAKGDFSRKVKVYGDDEIGQLASSFNDLTLKLEVAQEMTEEERRKLSSVLTHMSDGVIATDIQGRIILMNFQAEKILNVRQESLLDKSILNLLNLDDKFTLKQLYRRKHPLLIDLSTEDNPFIIKASFSVIRGDSQSAGLITVLHDVTEEEKNEQNRREFVANVSHELRTPLTTMKSYLEALADGAIENKELADRFIGVTQNETERMIRLVNDLLLLSKLDSNNLYLHKEGVEYISLFNQVIERFEMMKKQNVHFTMYFSNESLWVNIDEDKIIQVLDNIISNALKYSPDGGKIHFRVEKSGRYVLTSIQDEGLGIPSESIENIFDRFYRVDKARSRNLGGTGLGLAISREIIQLHRGEIYAESEDGKGTKISFTLPLYFQDREGEDT